MDLSILSLNFILAPPSSDSASDEEKKYYFDPVTHAPYQKQ